MKKHKIVIAVKAKKKKDFKKVKQELKKSFPEAIITKESTKIDTFEDSKTGFFGCLFKTNYMIS